MRRRTSEKDMIDGISLMLSREEGTTTGFFLTEDRSDSSLDSMAGGEGAWNEQESDPARWQKW